MVDTNSVCYGTFIRVFPEHDVRNFPITLARKCVDLHFIECTHGTNLREPEQKACAKRSALQFESASIRYELGLCDVCHDDVISKL
jgi:hypothetical protein